MDNQCIQDIIHSILDYDPDIEELEELSEKIYDLIRNKKFGGLISSATDAYSSNIPALNTIGKAVLTYHNELKAERIEKRILAEKASRAFYTLYKLREQSYTDSTVDEKVINLFSNLESTVENFIFNYTNYDEISNGYFIRRS